MGYRHIVVSQTIAPRLEDLPAWFADKYENIIDFEGEYWRSYQEHKRYGALSELEIDIQSLINSNNLSRGGYRLNEFQLVFFADEGYLGYGLPDVSHVLITKSSITETKVS